MNIKNLEYRGINNNNRNYFLSTIISKLQELKLVAHILSPPGNNLQPLLHNLFRACQKKIQLNKAV